MPLNRRDAVSFQAAVGRGCVSLIFTAVAGVGFSITKVVVGSEYIHSCPSKDMIPVYIVISGCLTVLLSSLRQPFSKGHNQEKEPSFTVRFAFITAVLGVVVNLAWLVAGTYLVVTTFQAGNICPSHDVTTGNGTNRGGDLILQYNFTRDAGITSSNHSSDYSAMNATGSAMNATASAMNATGSETKSNTVAIGHVRNNSAIPVDDKKHTNNRLNGIEHSNSVTSDGYEFQRNSTCLVCDLTILRFSFAVVVIDWIFVCFGLVYFCCFIKRFVSSLKNEFLINA